MKIINLPKVHLHHHLDCSLRLETVWDLALKNQVSLKSKNSKELFNEYKIVGQHKNLEEVLDRFLLCTKVIQTEEDISRVTFENIEDLAQQNVKLAELRFSPSFLALNKKLTLKNIIEAVLEGVRQGQEKYEIEVGLLCTLTREFDMQVNVDAVEEFIGLRNSTHSLANRLLGIDLAGQEKAVPPQEFAPILRKARENGLELSIHSGEDSSAEHLNATLEHLNPRRIGHGIRAIDDEAVMERLIAEDVLLEVCPISNWITAATPSYADHPIRKFYQEGVKVCLNTDDPQIFNIDLNQEYENAVKNWQFNENEFRQMNRWAFEHSFLPNDLKTKVEKYFS